MTTEIKEGDFVITKKSDVIGIVTGFHTLPDWDETYVTFITLTETDYLALGYQAEYALENIAACEELAEWQKTQLLYSVKKARLLLNSIESILEKFGVKEDDH